ncbi:unnamed protein product [Auanema sp. JU1783]|nr:unnamed protein product [Auanema sp. JU1783]
MLSRITRITSYVSPHVLGGCSLLRDAPTAPKVVPTVSVEQHILHDHAAYCKISLPPRQRNSSSSCDPFFGIGESIDLNDAELPSTPSRSRCTSTSSSSIENLFTSVSVKSEPESEENWLEGDKVLNLSSCAQYFASLTELEQSIESDSKQHWDGWDSFLDVKQEEPDEADQTVYESPRSEDDTQAVVPNIKSEPYDDYEDIKPDIKSRCIDNRYTPVRDWYYQPVVKKRGVTLKPRVDDETERRRAMNRVAALRYRERKRRDKHQMKVQLRELELRNRDLKQQEVRLRSEISKMKNKMQSL